MERVGQLFLPQLQKNTPGKGPDFHQQNFYSKISNLSYDKLYLVQLLKLKKIKEAKIYKMLTTFFLQVIGFKII